MNQAQTTAPATERSDSDHRVAFALDVMGSTGLCAPLPPGVPPELQSIIERRLSEFGCFFPPHNFVGTYLLARTLELALRAEGLFIRGFNPVGVFNDCIGIYFVTDSGPALRSLARELEAAWLMDKAELAYYDWKEGIWRTTHRPANTPVLPFDRFMDDALMESKVKQMAALQETAAKTQRLIEEFHRQIGGDNPS